MEADLTLIADQDVAGDYMDVIAALHRVAAGVPDLLAHIAVQAVAQERYRDYARSEAHDCTVAAQALMGVVGEIDNLEDAQLVTLRATQFEDEARLRDHVRGKQVTA